MESPIDPPLREAELIWRVVAWHNRHPLARRIAESQVRGVGVVAVPLGVKAPGQQARPLFSDDFIAPLKPASIARMAWRHGSAQRPGNDAGPIREIAVDPQWAGTAAEFRFLRTAAIELGGRRIRVLVGEGRQPRILGSRVWDQQRTIGLLALVTVLGIGATAAGNSWLHPQADVSVAQIRTVTPPEVRQQPAELPTPTGAAIGTTDEPALAAAAGEPDPAVGPTASAAEPVEPEGAEPHDDIANTTGAEPAENRMRPQTTPPGVEKPIVEAPVAAQPPASADSTVYALASMSTSSRLASQLRVDFMNMPTEPASDRPHAEVMRAGERWRVVIWPFGSQAAAESERKALAERGVKTELIAF